MCCACCVDSVLQSGLCNSGQFYNCFASPTPSLTPVSTQTSTWTPSITFSPIPTALPQLPSTQNNTLSYPTPCTSSYWNVPSGVGNVTLRLWGAGGNTAATGAGGAFVEGVAYVTSNETLQITVGGQGNPFKCGGGGLGGSYAGNGGGGSSVSRYNVFTASWVVIAIAGGGGGGGAFVGNYDSYPGVGIHSTDCGAFLPMGFNSTDVNGGGGGGWQGGYAGGYDSGGYGGTSCAIGCLSSTIISFDGTSSAFAPYENSPYWQPGVGVPSGPGLVVISWDGPNPSPSNSAAASASPNYSAPSTALPTKSASKSATLTVTTTQTSGVTPSATPTASVSPYCNPSVFTSFPNNDLVGSLLGTFSLQPSAYSCQLACCSTTFCDGFTFSTLLLQSGAIAAPCYLLANVTQLIPSHFATSGIRASVFSS